MVKTEKKYFAARLPIDTCEKIQELRVKRGMTVDFILANAVKDFHEKELKRCNTT